MRINRTLISLLVLLLFKKLCFCQPAYYISFTPFDKTTIANKDAKANGYFNQYNNEIIYNIQSKSKINRQLLDSSFNVKKSYSFESDKYSLTPAKKKTIFFKEFCTKNGNYEIYASKKNVELIKLDFENNKDVKINDFLLKKYYDDEQVLAITPYKNS